MASDLERFERIARRAYQFTDAVAVPLKTAHPFEARDVHPDLPTDVRTLFDNGHYAQATLEDFWEFGLRDELDDACLRRQLAHAEAECWLQRV